MCFPQESFSAPENTSCSRKYNIPQEISSNAGNIPQCRKYFLLQGIFFRCFPFCAMKQFLLQEIFPATSNISCHRKYFMF